MKTRDSHKVASESIWSTLQDGTLEGRSVADLVRLHIPAKLERIGNYTYIELTEVPHLAGTFVLAKDGVIVYAEEWSDWGDPTIYFDAIGEVDRQAADELYSEAHDLD